MRIDALLVRLSFLRIKRLMIQDDTSMMWANTTNTGMMRPMVKAGHVCENGPRLIGIRKNVKILTGIHQVNNSLTSLTPHLQYFFHRNVGNFDEDTVLQQVFHLMDRKKEKWTVASPSATATVVFVSKTNIFLSWDAFWLCVFIPQVWFV